MWKTLAQEDDDSGGLYFAADLIIENEKMTAEMEAYRKFRAHDEPVHLKKKNVEQKVTFNKNVTIGTAEKSRLRVRSFFAILLKEFCLKYCKK